MMRFGVTAFLTDYSITPADMARACEERGFDALYMPEHTHIPVSRETPAPMGEPLPKRYWHGHDPFVALTQAAMATEQLRIGTGILLPAQREPIVTAKSVASLDVLSGGRFVLGVGFGWNVEEMASHGVDFARRRDVVREHMLAMKALWTDDEPSFSGEFVSFGPSWSWPKPAQKPHPPIYVGGGGGPRMMQHIADWADGWMPIGGRGLKEKIPRLREAFEKAGRDPVTAKVIPFGSIPDAGKLEYFASLGIEEVVLGMDPGPPDVILPILDRYAETVGAL
jgi:probable F420-dependent oxidoreductase